MKTTVNFYSFRQAFEDLRPNNFSYEGLTALFEYLEEHEQETDTEIELDVIAICCDFTEYEDFKDLQSSYPDINSMEELRDHTTVIEIDGGSGFIIQNF